MPLSPRGRSRSRILAGGAGRSESRVVTRDIFDGQGIKCCELWIAVSLWRQEANLGVYSAACVKRTDPDFILVKWMLDFRPLTIGYKISV